MTTQIISAPDYEAIKGRQRQVWAAGDYHMIAAVIVPVAERLVTAVDIRAGERVLDVASGTGNAAIAAARRLARVTGSDFAPGLLERARLRASAEGLTIEFEEADAEALPYSDASFDVALSTFGVMFAPNQEQAASELLRVTRPGGRIGLANWTPDGFIGRLLKTVGRHVPPPAGVRPPSRWGDEAVLAELLGNEVTSMRVNRTAFTWHFETAEQLAELFVTYYGPTLKAHAALDEAGRVAFMDDLVALAREFNRADGAGVVIPADYLEVVAVRA